MNEMTITNLDRIATEINSIKQTIGRVMLDACIEVGRRLEEAKDLVPYGEWGEWVENNVDYSQRRANDMIKIYREYRTEQQTKVEDEDSQSIAKLDYTKGLALLALPKEERNEYLENNDVEDMTTKQLKANIKELTKERNAADRKFSKEQALRKTTEFNLRRAENNVLELKATIADMGETTSEDMKAKLEDAQKALQKKQDEVKQLKEKLEEKPKEKVVEVVPDAVLKQLEELKGKASSDESPVMVHFKFLLGEVVQDLEKLQSALADVKQVSDAEGEKCGKAVKKLLDRTLGGLG